MSIIKGETLMTVTTRQLYQVVQHVITGLVEEFKRVYKENVVTDVKQFLNREKDTMDFVYDAAREVGLSSLHDDLEDTLNRIKEDIDKEGEEDDKTY